MQDENGVYLGFTWIPAHHWSITAYSDFAYFAWPKYQTRESTQSWDNLVNILITDRYVFFYGDVWIEAADISRDKKHVYCDVSLCGSLVSNFRIPAQTFDRHFGLQENLPTQYRKRFLNGEEQAETKIECDEVSFADSDEGEQDEMGNAQIVAEIATESTNEKETTERTYFELDGDSIGEQDL